MLTDSQIIGIHNQDPLALFIQFSVGERDCVTRFESVKEELYEKKRYGRVDLDLKDEQVLLGKIMFNPKIKKVMKDYPF